MPLERTLKMRMLFSGKITNSIITFLQSQGVEASEFYDLTDMPVEFLKDPTCWLEAKKTEVLLEHLEGWAGLRLNLENPSEKIGHAAKDLNAWGVLDSVLRMIEKPQDIFLQPQRFLSYFISPAPPIANIIRGENSVSFDLPISYEEYPYVASYIRAAIETVPLFMGSQMAEAEWKQNRVSVRWDQSQSILDDSHVERRQMAPEVMQSLISTLEKTEQALLQKTRELEKIKQENTLAAQSVVGALEPLAQLVQLQKQQQKFQQQVLKLQDYFTRSQQLVTLLVGQDRLTPQVREAMRRVNWEAVQKSFSEVTQGLLSDPDAEAVTDGESSLNEESSEMTMDTQKMELEYGEQMSNHKSPRTRDSGQSWLPHS